MCMRNTSEGCILSEQQSALKKEVLSLDERMDKLEKDFATMRSETQDGFRQGAEVMRESDCTDGSCTRGVSACPEGWTVINTDA